MEPLKFSCRECEWSCVGNGAATTRIRPGAANSATNARSGSAFLTVLTGEGAGLVLSPRQRRLSLGRGENADIRLLGDTVSRNHAQITIDGDGFLKVTDIDSRNGTFVNGVCIGTEVLRDGDRVAFGGDVFLDIRYGHGGYRDAANMPNRSFGENGRQPFDVWHLASMLNARTEHTLQSYEQTLELRSRRMGDNDHSLAICLDVLGGLYRNNGKPDLAVQSHQRAAAIQRAIAFVGDLERAHTQSRLARALIAVGNYDAAQTALADASNMLGAAQPGERLEYCVAVAALRCHTEPSRFDDAIAEAKAEVAVLRVGGPFHTAKHDHFAWELDRLPLPSAYRASV